MSTFYVEFWSSYRRESQDFRGAHVLSDDFTFTTKVHGGFSTATFSIYDSPSVISTLYYEALGYHVDVYDYNHTVAFEGYINELSIQEAQLLVNCLGYYAHANNTIDDRIYVTSPTTLQTVVEDASELIPSWNRAVISPKYASSATYNLMTTDPETGAVLPLDFTDLKVSEALERCCAYGFSVNYPVPTFIALYEHRIPHLIKPLHLGFAETHLGFVEIYQHNIEYNPGSSISLNEVRNRVFAVYANSGEGPSKTTAVEDYFSKTKYGVIDGIVQNGGNQEGITMAEDLRDYALETYAFPRSSISVTVSGLLRHTNTWLINPWQLRAGANVLFSDTDLVYTDRSGELAAFSLGKYSIFVNSTSYSASSNSTTIDVGLTETAFNIFMSRLGIQGGIK